MKTSDNCMDLFNPRNHLSLFYSVHDSPMSATGKNNKAFAFEIHNDGLFSNKEILNILVSLFND